MQRFAPVFMITVLLLALAEAGARLAEWIHPLAGVSFDYAPYRMLKMSAGPWPLNREGFRARDLDSYHGGFLIEFLGGSVCVGVGTNPGATIPERLEDTLMRDGLAHAQVLNLCQGGATSAQELAIFIQYGLPLHPQVVLSFDGANDVIHPQPVGDDDGANLPYYDAELRERVEGRDALTHLALVRDFARFSGHWTTPRPLASSPVVPERDIIDSYLYALSVTAELARAPGLAAGLPPDSSKPPDSPKKDPLGARPDTFYAVLLQPTLHYRKPWSVEETAMWRRRRPSDAAAMSRFISGRYDAVRTALTTWSNKTGVPLYDLTPVFANTPGTVYSDSVHFVGSTGYRLLFDALVRQGLVQRIEERYRLWEAHRQPNAQVSDEERQWRR
jgi:lysophospholipase L1-like esterase